jgi:hypothetical protein
MWPTVITGIQKNINTEDVCIWTDAGSPLESNGNIAEDLLGN